MATSAQTNAKIVQFIKDVEIAHLIIHGGPTAVVATDGGLVRSLSNILNQLESDVNAAADSVLAQVLSARDLAVSSADSAEDDAAAALTSAQEAAASASSAADDATTSGTNATNAATAATNAATSANAAATSATSAGTSATSAANSATAAATSATNAATANTEAQTARTQATNAATTATGAATTATTAASGATASATAAAGSASAAAASETNAGASATAAAGSASAAAASATAAAESEEQAMWAASVAVNAPGTTATSASSITVGTGAKVLTLAQTDKAFVVGQWVYLVDTANPASRWMHGTVTAFNPATGVMTVAVVRLSGTGSTASWLVMPATPNYDAITLLPDGSLSLAADLTVGGDLLVQNGAPELGLSDTSNANETQRARIVSTGGHLYVQANNEGRISFSGYGGLDVTLFRVKVGGSWHAIWHAGNDGAASGLDADLLDGQQGSYYAPVASPAFTGTPTAPTAAVGTNSTQLATTAYVVARIANDAPTKTGVGASGTWGISISGTAANAAAVTNGVYTTGNQTIAGVKTFSEGVQSFGEQDNGTLALVKFGRSTTQYIALHGAASGNVLSSISTDVNPKELIVRVRDDSTTGVFQFGRNGVLTATGFAGSLDGNAATATALQTARTLTIGSTGKAFSGGANLAWSLTEILGNATPATAAEMPGGADLNSYTTPGFYYQTANADAASGTNYPVASAGSMVVMNSAGLTQQYWTYGNGSTPPRAFFRAFYSGSWSAWREVFHSGNIATASVASAGVLTTPRAINGTNFDGSAAITTASWGTARTLTIGSTGKSVNGGGNVAWSHAEMGVPSTGGTGATGTWGISITGNAATASALATARTINGVAFNGTANITIADSTKLPTAGGTITGNITLNDNVVARFGTGADFELFCNGTNAYMNMNSTGVAALYLRDGTTTRFTFERATGHLTATGDVAGLSDERLKRDWEDLPTWMVDGLADVRAGSYTRTDTGARQVGVSAQSLRAVMPEAVREDDEGVLSVSYGNAALAGVVALAQEVVSLRNRVRALEAH